MVGVNDGSPQLLSRAVRPMDLSISFVQMGGAVAEWVRALDLRPDGRGFESHFGKLFASELWQFRLPPFASVFRRRH